MATSPPACCGWRAGFQKRPEARFQPAHDLRVALAEIDARPAVMSTRAEPASWMRSGAAVGALLAIAVIAARVGDRVRISVQLIEAATDTPLWSNSYERDLGDILSLQATVAREIAHEIKATPLEEQRLAVAPAIDPGRARGLPARPIFPREGN